MTFRSRRLTILVVGLATVLSMASAAAHAAGASSEREKQTSGVAPDKATTSAGPAKSEGTGEGRQTPAEKAPTDHSGGR